MKIAIISFTQNGGRLCKKIDKFLKDEGILSTPYLLSKTFKNNDLFSVTTSLSEWTGKQFLECNAIIFVGATGIAVRAIAPYIKSKDKDPAIICIDELANYVISLLSGHLGGANELCLNIADKIGAKPIISTATDLNGVFAVDTWAKREKLSVQNTKAIKAVSSKILNKENVYLYSDYDINGEIPKYLVVTDEFEFFNSIKAGKVGIYISDRSVFHEFDDNMLWLTPCNLHLGFGCKKNVSDLQVETLFFQIMDEYDFKNNRVLDMNSIDIKANEVALLNLSKKLNIEFKTFSAESLKSVQGNFTPSNFVKSTVGVDNVCERAAMLAAGKNAKLLVKKTSLNGVTMAIAEEPVSIKF
ncbi:MAG: cobalt-precorrin 5A hydrolase [Eubacteriales bacterium]